MAGSDTNSPGLMPSAAYASAGGVSRQKGSPISSRPPGARAGRMRSMVPASPLPIQVAPMQATASNDACCTRNVLASARTNWTRSATPR